MRTLLSLLLSALATACDGGGTTPDAPTSGADVPGLDAPGAVGEDAPGRDTPALDGAIDFTPGVVPTEAPAWVADLVPGTWSAISLDTLRDHDPQDDPAANPDYPAEAPWRGGTGLAGVMTAWGGGALATGMGTHGALIVYGGGHGDYWGNEVYAFDLGTRRWSRLSNPYPSPMLGTIDAAPEGMYPDGTPVPSHSADRLEYHLGTNSFVALEGEVNNFGGYVVPNPYLFSLEHGTWRRGAPNGSGMGAIGWSAYDSRRDVFWTAGGCCGGPIGEFDPSTDNGDGTFGRWTNHESRPELNVNSSMAAYDPIHDLVAITTFRKTSDVWALDVAAPDEPPVRITTIGAAPTLAQAAGWEWSPSREAFLYWAGEHVHELRPTSGAWEWLDVTNPAGTVTPDYTSNGVFSRFRVMSYGALDVAIVVSSVDGPVYAFRVPAR